MGCRLGSCDGDPGVGGKDPHLGYRVVFAALVAVDDEPLDSLDKESLGVAAAWLSDVVFVGVGASDH